MTFPLERRESIQRPNQPRPQGLLAFQNGGGSGEDPGTQQITCLQRGWRCIQNGGYGEKGEKNWVRDAKVKINKWRKKLKFSSRKNRKNRHVLHVRVLGIRQSVRGLVFAVHCFIFVILKVRIMGLSVLDCRTPYRYLGLFDSMLLKWTYYIFDSWGFRQ